MLCDVLDITEKQSQELIEQLEVLAHKGQYEPVGRPNKPRERENEASTIIESPENLEDWQDSVITLAARCGVISSLQQVANSLEIKFKDALGMRLFKTTRQFYENTQSEQKNDSWLGAESEEDSNGLGDSDNKEDEFSDNRDEPLWLKLYTKDQTKEQLEDAAHELAEGIDCQLKIHEKGKEMFVRFRTVDDSRRFANAYRSSDWFQHGIKISKTKSYNEWAEAGENMARYK